MKKRLAASLVAFVFFELGGSSPDAVAGAQEMKPVPKNSVRVIIPGCSKGVLFVASQPAEDRPGGSAVPEGTRLRMNGPKKTMAEVKGQEGSRIEITGLIKRGQMRTDGIAVGGGARVGGGMGGPAAGMGRGMPIPGGNQLTIDIEGWRLLPGDCLR